MMAQRQSDFYYYLFSFISVSPPTPRMSSDRKKAHRVESMPSIRTRARTSFCFFLTPIKVKCLARILAKDRSCASACCRPPLA